MGEGGPAAIDTLVLADREIPSARSDWMDSRVELAACDVTDRDLLYRLVDRDDVSVFHLAAIVSAEAERDPELAWRVNVEGGRNVLDAVRRRAGCPAGGRDQHLCGLRREASGRVRRRHEAHAAIDVRDDEGRPRAARRRLLQARRDRRARRAAPDRHRSARGRRMPPPRRWRAPSSASRWRGARIRCPSPRTRAWHSPVRARPSKA